jgi:hypothetical protein
LSITRRLSPLWAAWVLVPLWVGIPGVLDDTRLDGALLAVLSLALLPIAWAQRAQLAIPKGAGLLILGLACGAFGLWDLNWQWVVSGLADRALWLAALAVLIVAVHAPASLQRSWNWIFVGVSLAATYGLLQLLGFDPLGLQPSPDLPPVAPLSSRAHAAEFYSVALLAGAAWLDPQKLLRWMAFLVGPAFLIGYFDMMGARLALLVGFAALAWRHRERLLPIGLLLLALLGGELTREISAPPFTVQDPGESGVKAWASVDGRILMYGACLDKTLGQAGGIGLGRFERDYPRWRPLAEQRMSSSNYQNITSRRPKTPHNEFLLALVEIGWLGALLLAVGAWRLLRDPTRARWTDPALLALLIHCLVRSPLSDNGPLLALAVILLASRKSELGARSAAAPPKQTAPSNWQNGWALATYASLNLLALLPAPAQAFGELGVAQRLPLTISQPPSVLEKAVDWRPWDSRAWGILASDLSQHGATANEVRYALEQALRYDSSDLFALTALFKLEMEMGLEAEALVLLGIAESYSPENPAVRANRTLYLRARADMHRLKGLELLKNKQPRSAFDLKMSQLWRAMAEIRDGNIEEARTSLRAAAVYATEKRGLIERISRTPNLNEATLHALLSELLPGAETIIGRPPPTQVD